MLVEKIDLAINKCRSEQLLEGSNPYLPTIIIILEKMKYEVLNNKLSPEERARMATGFGKIVLDNYAFAQSKLGLLLFEIANEFSL